MERVILISNVFSKDGKGKKHLGYFPDANCLENLAKLRNFCMKCEKCGRIFLDLIQ